MSRPGPALTIQVYVALDDAGDESAFVVGDDQDIALGTGNSLRTAFDDYIDALQGAYNFLSVPSRPPRLAEKAETAKRLLVQYQ